MIARSGGGLRQIEIQEDFSAVPDEWRANCNLRDHIGGHADPNRIMSLLGLSEIDGSSSPAQVELRGIVVGGKAQGPSKFALGLPTLRPQFPIPVWTHDSGAQGSQPPISHCPRRWPLDCCPNVDSYCLHLIGLDAQIRGKCNTFVLDFVLACWQLWCHVCGPYRAQVSRITTTDFPVCFRSKPWNT